MPDDIFTRQRSFNFGYNTTASGYSSHAEGNSTTASGSNSHAEGIHTTASGYSSHAEGDSTTASGRNSHAEGVHTTASGYNSHAEGVYTIASGSNSHAEGIHTTASGYSSHAEGDSTTASGDYSHAEGTYNDTGNFQYGFDTGSDRISVENVKNYMLSKNYTFNPFIGKFKLCEPIVTITNEDNLNSYLGFAVFISENEVHIINSISTNYLYTKRLIPSTNGRCKGYLHSVGNGFDGSIRSNAHTIDYCGVGWFKSGLQVGGAAQDDGAKNVMLEGEAVKIDDVKSNLPNSLDWSSIAYGNGKFVAIANDSDIAAYSEDGIIWEQLTLPISNNWKSIAYGNNKFVVVSNSSNATSNIVIYSEDAINWTQITLPVSGPWASIAYGNGKFVAINSSLTFQTAIYSEDGINWTQVTLPKANYWSSLTFGDGKFVAVGSPYNNVIYSEDGITWQSTVSTTFDLESIIYGNGKFVAIGINTTGSVEMEYSESGTTNWTQVALPTSNKIKAIAYGNNKFIIIGYNSSVAFYSEDGINWTQTTLPISSLWDTIIYNNNKFITIASNTNEMAYSYDGITWYNTYEALTQNNEDVTDKVRDLLLDSYTIPAPPTASVGQTIVVSEVDENGKPTKWEAADVGGGVLIIEREADNSITLGDRIYIICDTVAVLSASAISQPVVVKDIINNAIYYISTIEIDSETDFISSYGIVNNAVKEIIFCKTFPEG